MILAHLILVNLFLVHYLIKTILLLVNSENGLTKYSKVMRIPEMLISVGFLGTGVALIINGAPVTTLLMIKIVLVLASIPLAVIGFKKKNKAIAILAFLCIVMAYGLGEMNKAKKTGEKIEITDGKAIYEEKCSLCHGSDGKAGLSGASDLSKSSLSIDEIKTIVKEGRNSMPGYGTTLSDEQVQAVAEYSSGLKN